MTGIQSTIPNFPLTIRGLFEHGERLFASSEISTWTGDGVRRASYREVGQRVRRLAAALAKLGIRAGDRVGTFAWNNQEHLEAYFGVPAMGAVLHCINIRLFPEQLIYIINHAADRIVIVDSSLTPLLGKIAPHLKTVERYIVIGEGGTLPGETLRYEEAIAGSEPVASWPEMPENTASSMCYTSGTTGNPKGVVYSHRSTYLHALASLMASSVGLTDSDKVLPVVPMFHANAWGLPYSGWLCGADILMPDRFLQAESICRMIVAERPTLSGAVPTIWNDVLRYVDAHGVDVSSLRCVLCGGAAVPRSMQEGFLRRHGVRVVQGWGMTETSPLGAVAVPPRGTRKGEELEWMNKSGRIVAGIEMRLMDGDRELPWDGAAVGEIEVRGPWVTGSYYLEDAPEKFHGGWLRTGDVGVVDAKGYLQITDRSKDVIKSGGEWISSMEMENHLIAHPDVLEAVVIGVPDERWDERPLACVVMKPGATATVAELREFLAGRVARWWLPERWALIAEIPKTSVGKLDKKVLRARYARGEIHEVKVAKAGA
ncbi:MAG TPA: long-chain fatty acid--CoA ligase [Bryobacteraceae bacterium]|nr:long-chain fatty acid--CoA ligase [Bryobacteraceae bacterium]